MADIGTEDGIVIRNYPDGQDPMQDQALKDYLVQVRAGNAPREFNYSPSPQNQPSAQVQGTDTFTPTSIPQPPESQPNVLQQMGQDFKGGLDATIRGAVPLLTADIVSAPLTATMNKLLGTNYETPREGMLKLLESAGVEAPETKAGQIVESMSEAILGTMASLGAGGVMQAGKALTPTATKAIGQTLSSQPAQQLAGAATSAGVAKLTEQAGLPVPVQIGASLGAGILGSNLSNIKGSSLPTAPIQQAKNAGVDLLTSDVRPPRTFASKMSQSIGEKIPIFGTGKLRETQQTQRISAVKNLLQKHGIDDLASMSDESVKVAEDLIGRQKRLIGAYSGAKNEVIDRLSDADVVPMTKTIAKIDEQISRLKGLKNSQLEPLIGQLEETKLSVSDQSLRNVEENRKLLGDFFDTMKDDKAISRNKSKVLTDVYGSVNDDMGDYIKLKGDAKDFTKWKVTNKAINKNLENVKTDILKRTMNKGEATPEIVKNVLFSKKASEVKDLFNNLSPRGKASARTAILSKAAENSQFIDSDTVSPDKFANAVKKLGDQTGVFFSGDDLKQVKGLMKVLNTTRRAGSASAAPPTGVQNLLPVGAAGLASTFGGGLEGFLGTLAAGAGIGGVARLYESKAVRNILMKLPSVAAGSPQEAALFKRLAETTRAIQATQATQATQEKEK